MDSGVFEIPYAYQLSHDASPRYTYEYGSYLTFENGGVITFDAVVISPTRTHAHIRFEQDGMSLSGIDISNTVTTYTVQIPSQPINKQYSTLWLFIDSRQVKVKIYNIQLSGSTVHPFPS